MPRVRRRPVATDRRFRKQRPIADYGPAERWQHSRRSLEPTGQGTTVAARATEEHLVDVMVMLGLIDGSQREAALKFKLDYQRAGLAAHVTGSYNPLGSGGDYFRGGRERSDFEEAAYQRWRNAARMLGLRLGSAVVSTVCHDLPPGAGEIPFVQKGLEKLADWYRLSKRAVTAR